ncbi:hypothetical protein FRC11_011034 [Ceratobasidium sp. 423]|nr:hypothetical protein FRC11_011034 [Ceratobasidium sp. 423]
MAGLVTPIRRNRRLQLVERGLRPFEDDFAWAQVQPSSTADTNPNHSRACGKTATVTYVGKSITVGIVDRYYASDTTTLTSRRLRSSNSPILVLENSTKFN